MATSIYNYDGSLLASVADGEIDETSASIRFPGRGYVNYGAPVNENLLWIAQNFARGTSPTSPVNGQTWYDTTNKLLKVYDTPGASWVSVGGVVQAATPPPTCDNVGAFWYDTNRDQLHVWDGSAWLLVGPLGASDALDPINPVTPGYSAMEAIMLSDGTANHSCWRLTVGGTAFVIFSKDATFTASDPAINAAFGQIHPGINFNTGIAGIGITGDTTVFKNDQNNLPDNTATWDLGSNSKRFKTVYAATFDGVATSAKYADLAERYHSDREYPAGTVVCIGGDNEITVSGKPGDDQVLGVISTQPAHLMNSAAGDSTTHPPVALAGRVPCKVVGQIKKGQRLMTSSMEGVACAWDPAYGYLSIIGRSLTDKATHGVGSIEIVVGKN